MDEKLFIRIASQLGRLIHPLGPCFLDDGLAGAGFFLVEGCDVVEVDVFVERGLQGRRDVIRVVVLLVVMVMVVVAAVTGVFVMTVRHVGARSV